MSAPKPIKIGSYWRYKSSHRVYQVTHINTEAHTVCLQYLTKSKVRHIIWKYLPLLPLDFVRIQKRSKP